MSWKLYEGDCFDYLPLIEDKSIDMILCDLPYGTTACKWDTPLPLEKLWVEYKRVIKDNGAIVLTASQPFTTTLIGSNMDMFRYEWIWHKSRKTGFLNAKKSPMKEHENILIFYKNQPTYNQKLTKLENPINSFRKNGKGGNLLRELKSQKNRFQEYSGFKTSILKINNEHNVGSHPTQKPVALFEYLIKTYTNAGDLVLDNCAGSGTTGVACQNLNRNSILIEKEPDYCQIIRERMATTENLIMEARKQQTLQAYQGQQTLTSH